MKINEDIRDSYKILPMWSQNFLTWLTGKALPGQKPKLKFSYLFYFFMPLTMVVGGVLSSLIILTNNFSWFLLTLSWVITLSGTRSIALTVRHQCVHSVFSGNPKLDMFLAEIATSIVYGQDAKSYKKDHIDLHHNRKVLAGYKDSHVMALERYGFIPGMSRCELWENLLCLIFSPLFQFKHSLARLKCNFYYPSFSRILLSCFTALVWTGIFIYFSSSAESFLYNLFFAFVAPLFLLCNISVILEMIAEHEYFDYSEEASKLTSNDVYASKCWAIFCGVPLPKKSNNIFSEFLSWLIWIIQMIVQLIIRLTILPGDIVTHDFHHRHPYSKEWKTYSYARQNDIEKRDSKWPEYREVWGLFNAIDKVFLSMSRSKKILKECNYEPSIS